MSREWPALKVRLPPDLKTKVERDAERNRRTVNGEIVHRIECYGKAETTAGPTTQE